MGYTVHGISRPEYWSGYAEGRGSWGESKAPSQDTWADGERSKGWTQQREVAGGGVA